ncbi:MAG: calcium-binding protein [Acidimicrobiales bacterium]
MDFEWNYEWSRSCSDSGFSPPTTEGSTQAPRITYLPVDLGPPEASSVVPWQLGNAPGAISTIPPEHSGSFRRETLLHTQSGSGSTFPFNSAAFPPGDYYVVLVPHTFQSIPAGPDAEWSFPIVTIGTGGRPSGGDSPTEGGSDTCGGRTPTIVGTTGDDVLRGTRGNDVIAGLAGNDRIIGRGGNDIICAGPGRDVVIGGAGRDRLFGQAGRDTLRGGPGNDLLHGGAGRDRGFGGPGTDRFRSVERRVQ